ncbi:methyltransferase family protein [Bacillus sp. RAR_GA_16]|uniref:methyltransferase family protein n=1 Tax=Bacillus sp. RAR_GA_16 TaxID=2876774 RepID=UPI001CC952DF|nr:isoprenylcysteine carboxylmethyltransferase family protein [Bacillus sp. RAR_GA_16]MCA0171444.1 isoprenylcysteine carboxylmethyltransferase family protein [Bacillus sp. RAR_GA_16]
MCSCIKVKLYAFGTHPDQPVKKELWYTAGKRMLEKDGGMVIVDVLFVLLSALWIGEFLMKRGKKNAESSSSEKRSFVWILCTISLAIVSSIIFSHFHLFVFNETLFTQLLGLILYGCGIGLRYWGIKELGRFFSRNVIVERKVDLVSSGPYRLLRHPLYTGLLLTLIGLPIYIGTWGGIVLSFLLLVPALLYRIRIEERMLYASVGETYYEWGKERYRLLPFIY